MAREITDYRCLNISKLKEWGYLENDPKTTFKTGVISWERYGETVAQITVSVRMGEAEQSVAVLYSYNGEKKAYVIQLDFAPSNLPNHSNTGYYYFVCPVTGERCRKLYLVGGVFMCRRAFRPLYAQQTMSKATRAQYAVIDSWMKIDDLEKAGKRRKLHYRGKPTPYQNKLSKYYSRV